MNLIYHGFKSPCSWSKVHSHWILVMKLQVMALAWWWSDVIRSRIPKHMMDFSKACTSQTGWGLSRSHIQCWTVLQFCAIFLKSLFRPLGDVDVANYQVGNCPGGAITQGATKLKTCFCSFNQKLVWEYETEHNIKWNVKSLLHYLDLRPCLDLALCENVALRLSLS